VDRSTRSWPSEWSLGFPHDLIATGWETITRDDEDIGELLDQLDCPLLFAEHKGCLMSTEEGFEDAAAAFPRARTIAVEDAPTSSRGFAEALREFCMEARRLENSSTAGEAQAGAPANRAER